MNGRKTSSQEQLKSVLRLKLESSQNSATSFENIVTNKELSMLFGELEIFQLELEMQNDELSASYQLLETERSKFAGFFNMAPVGYFILDELGVVEEANQTGADLLKISKTEILSKRFQSFIRPEMWEHFYAFLHKMQFKTDKQNCEITLCPGFTEVHTRMEGIAIKHSYTGKLQYYITVTDISESRAAQQRLLDTTRRLEMTLKASGMGTWTMEAGANKVFLDDFSLDLIEIKAWEFEGTIKSFIALVYTEDEQLVKQAFSSTIHQDQDLEVEFRVKTRSNKIKTITIRGQLISNDCEGRYFAGTVMDITERKRLILETEQVQNQQQKLIASATFKAQEKERNKMSHTLHDSVCQILYGIRLHLQNIQHGQNLTAQFANVNALLNRAIVETRDLSYELTPSVLRDFGFTEGVKEMVLRLSTPHFSIKTAIRNTINSLHPEIQLYLFRMIQELLNNCIKHASASEVKITACTEGEQVNLSVMDNGKGFDTEIEEAITQGSGMRSIKNRIFLLNGAMNIETSGSGTIVTIGFKNDIQSLGISFSV